MYEQVEDILVVGFNDGTNFLLAGSARLNVCPHEKKYFHQGNKVNKWCQLRGSSFTSTDAAEKTATTQRSV